MSERIEPPVEAVLDPDRNEIHVYDGDDLALSLTFPEVRQLVAQIANIMAHVREQQTLFAVIVRGQKGAPR